MQNKNREMVLSTADLTAVGINAQLTSNDLVEVVAHGIYDKFMSNINEIISRSKEIRKKWMCLFDVELDSMKKELIKGNYLNDKEEVSTEYGRDKVYFNGSVSLYYLKIEEKEKGSKVWTDSSSFSYPTGTRSKIKLTVTVNDYDNDNKVSFGDISGNIEVRTSKYFNKVILVPFSRFKSLIEETKTFNADLQEVTKILPANGLLSVERFTREARVKMNKKIISSQSPEFRNKMSELFNIQL